MGARPWIIFGLIKMVVIFIPKNFDRQ
jgi:hypothetical protein